MIRVGIKELPIITRRVETPQIAENWSRVETKKIMLLCLVGRICVYQLGLDFSPFDSLTRGLDTKFLMWLYKALTSS
ncbi:9501_t:CDS:2 [Rhizophagus irregularis]|nr:9501_t:CDS:2 [Rhizophagus irregularis]